MSSTPNVVKNRLRFDFTKEQLAQDTEKLISSSRQTQDKVAALKEEERTFKSVVLPLAYDESEFATLSSLLSFPSYVHPVKELRDESSESNKKIEEFEIESSMREDVYNAVKTVYNKEFSSLKPEDQRIISRIIRDFERNGLGLDKEKREKVKELKAKLSKLSIDFQKNLNEDKTELLFTEQELEGLPKDFIENLKVDTNSGKRIVTLKYTDLFPVLKFCKVEETRKQLEFANSAKCLQVNTPLLEQALQIRQEVAQLLGYKTHAHYVLDVRMAKNPESVSNFLNSLKNQLTEGGKKELQRLLKLKEEETTKLGQPFDGKINGWDFQYYHTLLKEREFEVNDNEIKDYFPADYTFGALLDIAQQLFGLKFVKIENPEKELIWHEEVQYYQVFDEATNDYVGAFYLDLFPRDGKYGHAAAFPLQVHYVREDESSVQRAISAMVCNFSKPTATKPSLLKHDEVVTLWHEFGHLCHGFATKTKYGRFSGTSVERDFVECPSQFMENFCWEVEGLKRISKHYVTGEPLPEETIKKMIAAKNLNVALLTLRQLFFGLFDMHCHLTSPTTESKPLNTAEIWGKFREDVTLIPNTPGTNGAAGFGHIMGGYDVGYYGYLWSLVFSADIFVQFKTNGLFNSEIGKQYRKKILETGGMRDGIDMLKDFLGREPNNDAFLESIGLK